MDWHEKYKSVDDVLCIHIDNKKMKHIEDTWINKFWHVSRSVILGLAIDHINTFYVQSSN